MGSRTPRAPGGQLGTVKAVVDWVASLSMVAVAVALLTGYVKIDFGSTSPRTTVSAEPRGLPAEPVELRGIRLGDERAKAVLIVFSDFDCPFCRQFARAAWPRLMSEYVRSGRLQVAFVNLPLTAIHPRAEELAQAAVCAARQGAFEAAHDSLFLSDPATRDWTVVLDYPDLDRPTIERCMAADGRAAVDRDLEFAKDLAVSATPTLMFGSLMPDGKVRIVLRRDGAMSFDELSTVIARTLVVED